MKLKSLAAVGACAALVFCGCEKTEESSAVQSEYVTTTVTDSSPTPVEVRTYEFPEFLNGEKTGDMLANVVSGGFDPTAAAVKAEESPSEEHKAVQCLLGEYYTFLDSGYIGIMNSGGNVIIKPEKYNSVKAVSNELLALGYIDEDGDKTDYYLVRGGYCKPVAAGFRQEDIEVTEIPPENEQASAQYCLSVRGAAATDAYDSIEPLTQGALKTAMIYRAAYKAVSGGRYYYLVLDEYYNITVCEAAYAQIRMKIGGTYGECYILNGDHYTELNKMIKSFGREQQAVKPSKDETLDYIQIVFGICTGEQLTVTVSADGLCLTDGLTVKGQPINKYFSAYPKDAFADLVGWVGEVAASEYEAK